MTNNETTGSNGLRSLPSVDRVLAESVLAETLSSYKREIVVDAVRDELTVARADVAAGGEAP